jgi:hypothetical protein
VAVPPETKAPECAAGVDFLGFSDDLDEQTFEGTGVGGLSGLTHDVRRGVYYSLVNNGPPPARRRGSTSSVLSWGLYQEHGASALYSISVHQNRAELAYLEPVHHVPVNSTCQPPFSVSKTRNPTLPGFDVWQ